MLKYLESLQTDYNILINKKLTENVGDTNHVNQPVHNVMEYCNFSIAFDIICLSIRSRQVKVKVVPSDA